MRSLVAAALAAALPVLAAGPALAETYAAIAYSQSNGTTGLWHRATTRAAAEEGALQECGPGCEVVIWARDACAVLVVGAGRGYGVYWSTDEDEAVSGAFEECEARTSDCELEATICSAY